MATNYEVPKVVVQGDPSFYFTFENAQGKCLLLC